MSAAARFAPRFRGAAATERSQHIVGFLVVALLAALSLAGVVGGAPVIAMFAIGAGAGYSLSGSV